MEAVAMLSSVPGYDVGVHLCLTSEWIELKWRPLTPAASLRNPDGYFHPFIWPNDFFAKNQGNFLNEKNYSIKEIEQ